MYSQYTNPVAVLNNRKTEIFIIDLPARLGRNNNTVDIYFFHESVSREHCLFECINSRITVRDLGSTVGTYLNGVKLEPNVPYNIDDGMKITIGKVKFLIHVNQDELAARESPQSQNRMPSVLSGGARTEKQRADWYSSDSVSGGIEKHDGIVTVSAKELNEYEYDESEVVHVECGLTPEAKPLSYTSDLVRVELEKELKKTGNANEEEEKITNDIPEPDPEEDEKKTQMIDAEEILSSQNVSAVHSRSEEDADVSEDKDVYPDPKAETEMESKTAAEPESILRLSWMDDETGEQKKITIDHFPFRIGRKSDENDYTVRRKGVSRRHLYFEADGGMLYVIDDRSTNGVRLNGTKIHSGERTEVRSGDSIRIADVTFEVSTD